MLRLLLAVRGLEARNACHLFQDHGLWLRSLHGFHMDHAQDRVDQCPAFVASQRAQRNHGRRCLPLGANFQPVLLRLDVAGPRGSYQGSCDLGRNGNKPVLNFGGVV